MKLDKETKKTGGRKLAFETRSLDRANIGAAIEVHQRLEPAFLESVYVEHSPRHATFPIRPGQLDLQTPHLTRSRESDGRDQDQS